MSETIYELRELAKFYGARCVLRVHELDIHRGEVLGVVGPSGAGKSTLLRLLNFIESPSAGTLRFLGNQFDATQSAPLELRRRVTMVFQRPVLLKSSVWDNVRYGLWLRGESDAADRVGKALEQVGLTAMARQDGRTLSGGELQRVALARAMVLRPDVLLLDEPTANLDPYNVGLIEGILTNLNRERGITIVVVTHNVFQARRLAQRVGLLLDGHLVEVADVNAFFQSPHDARTAAFARGEMVY
jgi:tungstate transport system ATP-binding protein